MFYLIPMINLVFENYGSKIVEINDQFSVFLLHIVLITSESVLYNDTYKYKTYFFNICVHIHFYIQRINRGHVSQSLSPIMFVKSWRIFLCNIFISIWKGIFPIVYHVIYVLLIWCDTSKLLLIIRVKHLCRRNRNREGTF
jgi:hypothetical protein